MVLANLFPSGRPTGGRSVDESLRGNRARVKVLYVTHGFPPDQMAGAEVYSFAVAREVRNCGVEPTVVAPAARPGLPEYGIVEEAYEGVRILRLNQNYADLYDLESTYAGSRGAAAVAAILDRERPDLVHIQHVIGTSCDVILEAKKRGIPVVLTLHDFWFQCPRGQRMTPRRHLCRKIEPWRCALCVGKKRVRYLLNFLGGYATGKTADGRGRGAVARALFFLPRLVRYLWREAWTPTIRRRTERMRAALLAADLVIAPSEFMRAEFSAWGVPDERMVFSEYGMDHELFRAARARPPRLPGAPIRFGFVGTLIPNKGPDLLIEAFQGIPAGRASLEIFGAGGGPNGPRFEAALKAQNRHPGLSFRGRFDNQRIAAILGSLDVLVVPSLWYENAPLTLHEAALAGIATVTSDHGGMREFAERFGNALLFKPGDAGALRAQLMRLIDEPALLATLRPKRQVRTIEDDARSLVEHYGRLVREKAQQR